MLLPQTIDQIEEALLSGASNEDAARRAHTTLRQLEEHEAGDPAIAERLEAARARSRIENLALIKRAAIGHPSRVITEEIDPVTGRTLKRTTIERTEFDWRAASWLEEHPPARPQIYRGGRSSLLTAEAHEEICASFRVNPHIEPAAASAGISMRSLQSWLSRGRAYRDFIEHGDLAEADPGTRRLYHAAAALWPSDKQAALSALALVEERCTRPEDEPYLRLLQGAEEATGALERELFTLMLDGARRDPKLAERALRLLFRARYGDRVELSGEIGIAVDIEQKRAEAAELVERIEEGRAR